MLLVDYSMHSLGLSIKSYDKYLRSTKVYVRMAYAPSPEYRQLHETLRSVLEHHFNCEVYTYTGSPNDK